MARGDGWVDEVVARTGLIDLEHVICLCCQPAVIGGLSTPVFRDDAGDCVHTFGVQQPLSPPKPTNAQSSRLATTRVVLDSTIFWAELVVFSLSDGLHVGTHHTAFTLHITIQSSAHANLLEVSDPLFVLLM